MFPLDGKGKSQLDIDIENFERNESEERKKQEKLQKELQI